MRNLGKAVYLLACLLVCAFPFVGMLTGAENGTAENRTLAKLPEWEGGKWNPYFLQELGAYFEDHFALRPLLVAIDANIQSRFFGVSNVDTVTVGEEGWLYYTSSIEDYQGKPALSQRGIANAVHNLSLMHQYVEGKGAAFLFVPVPNKSSLYGAYMPYYIQKAEGAASQWERMESELEGAGVPYVDLFSLFESQDEVLYLKRDSHWNQKGAMLAYRAMMESLSLEHEDYETVRVIRQKDAYGDLSRMLYPLGNEKRWDWASPLKAEPEWEYRYQKEDAFQYRTDTKSTEEAWIETESQEGQKTLLMSRDSFGNTLLPFLANEFGKGYFSRGVPFGLTEYMEAYKPDVVILEKVERELEGLAQTPPLMEGIPVEKNTSNEKLENSPGGKGAGTEKSEAGEAGTEKSGAGEAGTEKSGEGEAGTEKSGAEKGEAGIAGNAPGGSLEMAESENNVDYWKISGVLPDSFCKEDAQIYIRVKDGEKQTDYAAFHISVDGSDYGYCLYLKKESLQSGKIGLETLLKTEEGTCTVQSAQVSCDMQ